MRLKTYFYVNIQYANPKDKASPDRGGTTFPNKLVENRGLVLKSISFWDKDLYLLRTEITG